jgi:hypothetical protein
VRALFEGKLQTTASDVKGSGPDGKSNGADLQEENADPYN